MGDGSAAILAAETNAGVLTAALPIGAVVAKSRAELVAVTALRNDVVIAFVELELVHLEDIKLIGVPIVGIVNDTRTETIAATIAAFESYPWLTHTVSLKVLSTPQARTHLTGVLDQILEREAHSTSGIGRVARLATASKREQRFDRMREFFAKHGLTERTITAVTEIAEELVMNALYDAPVEGGFFKSAVPRTEDVDLPHDRACEISYGVEDGSVFVRVLDTFGALARRRVLDVLNRCSSKGVVELDESRGGAGLGLWRIFTAASAVSITVAAGETTDILIRIATKDGRIVKQLAAVSMRFVPVKAHQLRAVSANGNDAFDMFDNSVTLAG
jgi:hypothetical protein